MKKRIICKLKEDKQDEFIENYEFQSYKYANKDDCEYCDGRYATAKHNLNILQNGSENDE